MGRFRIGFAHFIPLKHLRVVRRLGYLWRYAALTGSIKLTKIISLAGASLAIVVLWFCTIFYAGDIPWTQVTVSWLCAPNLPDGSSNSVRPTAIIALLVLCVSMAMVFQLISRTPEFGNLAKTIQISGIGSMVYALLTITPMHNLIVNIALVFFLVAISAIAYLKFQNRQYWLATIGLLFIVLKLLAFSLYLANSNSDIWGVLQKLLFLGTTAWLFVVLWTKPKTTPSAA